MVQNKTLATPAVNVVAALSQKQFELTPLLSELKQHRDAVEPDINAFDSLVANPKNTKNGLLHGLPITVKDQIAVADMPRNFGLDAEAKNLCTETASAIQKFIDAGATIIGKTSMPPYALDLQTSNQRVGRTNNPWHTARTAGGSSGGGAAAVASGMSFLDIGADLSGSLRLPAAFCGVYSLLPSEGAIENDGLMLDGNQLNNFARLGPITRCVEDLALAWQVLSGTQVTSKNLSALSIGVGDYSKCSNETIQVIKNRLASLPADVFQLTDTPVSSLFQDDVYKTFGEIMGFETGEHIPAPIRFLMRMFGKDVTSRSPKFLSPVYSGYRRNKENYRTALARKRELQTEFENEVRDFDVILLPVCGVQAFEHRTPASERNGIRDYKVPFEIAGSTIGYLDALTAYTVPVSLMGSPVVTVPFGLDENGLPTGMQLIGKRGEEWALLSAVKLLAKHIPVFQSPYLLRASCDV